MSSPTMIRPTEAQQYFTYRLAAKAPLSTIQRLEIPIPKMDLLRWLQGQTHTHRFYWSSPNREMEVAAVGLADSITTSESVDYKQLQVALDRRLQGASDQVRYYGATRFDGGSSKPSRVWLPFGSCTFFLPRFEIVQTREGASLVCHRTPLDQDNREQIGEDLRQLTFSRDSATNDRWPKVLRRTDKPNRSQWDQWVTAASQLSGRDKMVLARQVDLSLSHPLCPIAVIRHWKEEADNAYLMAMRVDGKTDFLTRTPEVLFRRRGRVVQSDAVAGTRPGSADKSELLGSEKDLREHRFVMNHIEEVFSQTCSDIQRDNEVSVLQGKCVQHLLCRFQGTLNDNVTDMDLLQALHPTPAVGGTPTYGAEKDIHEIEQMDRGLYAGPIGWVSNNAAEFSVGIRSGLLNGDQLRIFAGAGLVSGSNVEAEWNEAEAKLGNFLGLFNT